jgi:peptidoglycan L-alanyl-D-glutamate endopeptidase CwlK
MPKFSQTSKDRLATCDTRLQALFNSVVMDYDCAIICGFRNKEDQDKAYAQGYSKARWPNGNHNRTPSLAVDVMPVPIIWEDIDRLNRFAVVVKARAKQMGIAVEWGGDWRFVDRPHWEVKP